MEGGVSLIRTIDIAHPPLSSAEAERLLEDELRRAVLSGNVRVLRVIHGYGSSGRGGTLKTLVANWAYTRRAKFSLVVPGERFSPYDRDIRERIMEPGGPGLQEFADANEGVTFLFLKSA